MTRHRVSVGLLDATSRARSQAALRIAARAVEIAHKLDAVYDEVCASIPQR